jgi:hypothetical protein
MTEEENLVRQKLQKIARNVQAELPGHHWGFILLCFPFGEGGECLYVANAHRDDAIQAMREFIAKNMKNRQAFTDQGEGTTADKNFEAWWKQEISRLPEGKCPTEWASVRQLALDAFLAGMVWSVA